MTTTTEAPAIDIVLALVDKPDRGTPALDRLRNESPYLLGRIAETVRTSEAVYKTHSAVRLREMAEQRGLYVGGNRAAKSVLVEALAKQDGRKSVQGLRLQQLQEAAGIDRRIIKKAREGAVAEFDVAAHIAAAVEYGPERVAGVGEDWAEHQAIQRGWHIVLEYLKQGRTPVDALRRGRKIAVRGLTRSKGHSSSRAANMVTAAEENGWRKFLDASDYMDEE